jgi:hypothetical protein
MYLPPEYDESNVSSPSELISSSAGVTTTYQLTESLSDDSMSNQSNERHLNVIHEGFSEPFINY